MPRLVAYSQSSRTVLNMNTGGASERHKPSDKERADIKRGLD